MMKPLRALIAVLVLLTGSASLVNAMDAERMGVGLETCGEFASLYRRVPNITEQSSWAQGYMSGMNMASLAHGDISKNMGAMAIDEQERTLRKYCNDHPLANVQDAAMELLKSLPRLKRTDDASAPR